MKKEKERVKIFRIWVDYSWFNGLDSIKILF